MGTAARDTMRPERPFPFIQSPARASVDAKPYPAVFRVIRQIVVPTGRGAMMPDAKPYPVVLGRVIRAIVVPTGPGAT